MKEEKFPHTRKALHGQRSGVAERESFGAMEESTATGVRRAKRRDSRTEDQGRTAITSPRGLSAHPQGWAGLGVEARALVGAGEGWGWRREHSLQGVSAPRLDGRESGESLDLLKRQETFSSLFVSWCVRLSLIHISEPTRPY